MKYKNILLTGASGTLGQAIVKSGHFSSLLTPSMAELDITKPESIEKFFGNNDIDAIIHCAALARLKDCEDNPNKAIQTNIVGTSNLVKEVLKKENKTGEKIRFVHISTDGIYQSTEGNYKENGPTIPYNIYGWTKLGAECAVNSLSNFCIIRTRFFDPEKINFDTSATDIYTSKLHVVDLVKSIAKLTVDKFIGIVNVGGERKSDYELNKMFNPSIKPCKYDDIAKDLPFRIAKDASMDCSLWKKLSGG